MRTPVLLALLLAAAPAARAADPALLADAMKDLSVDAKSWDERAVLAALLARPAESAEFDADAREALKDPVLRPLFILKWRRKAALFAETESHIPYVPGGRAYANWSEVMSPEQRAYTLQRMRSMAQDDKDKLIYYLNKLNQNLIDDHGNLDAGLIGVSRKIANGVMDKYREDLTNYLASAPAQDGEKNGAAAAQKLAAAIASRRQATQVASAPAVQPVEPAAKPSSPDAPRTGTAIAGSAPTWQQSRIPRSTIPQPRVKPALSPSPATISAPPPPPGQKIPAAPDSAAPVVVTGPSHGAMDQAEAAARAGQAAGGVFDGGAAAAPVQGPSVAAGAPGLTKPSLTASTPRSATAAAEPPAPGVAAAPAGSEEDFMKQVAGMGSGHKPTIGHTPLMLSAGGALLGGLIGFLLGGPIGAAIGAVVLGGGAYLATKNFF